MACVMCDPDGNPCDACKFEEPNYEEDLKDEKM